MEKRKNRKRKLLIFGGIGVLLVIILIAFIGGSKDDIISVQTEKVEKRDYYPDCCSYR